MKRISLGISIGSTRELAIVAAEMALEAPNGPIRPVRVSKIVARQSNSPGLGRLQR